MMPQSGHGCCRMSSAASQPSPLASRCIEKYLVPKYCSSTFSSRYLLPDLPHLDPLVDTSGFWEGISIRITGHKYSAGRCRRERGCTVCGASWGLESKYFKYLGSSED